MHQIIPRKGLFLTLVAILVLTACSTTSNPTPTNSSVAPQVEDAINTANTFLGAWVNSDYTTMYGLLSPKSLAMSLGEFTKIYQQAEQTMKLVEHGKAYELHSDQVILQGTTAVIHYNMTFKSSVLMTFTDTDRVMRLVLTPQGWRVAWSEMDIFEGMASGSQLHLELIQSPRGAIYDRNNKPIALDAAPNVAVRLLTRSYPTQNPQDCFKKLAEVLRIREADLESYAEFTGLDYGFTVGHLSTGDVPVVRPELDAVCKVEYRPQTTRFYYGGGLAPQTIGFVGPIPVDEVGNEPQYDKNWLIGRLGIEQTWQKQLAGESGARLVIHTLDDLEVRPVYVKQPGQAQDVTVTLDRNLQLATEQALSSAYNTANWAQFSTGAAAVVLDVNTGEILALASYPSVDPDAYLLTTSFDTPTTQQTYDKRHALFNRATQGLYALGSVFKIVSMAAAVDTGSFKLNQLYTDTGLWDGTQLGDQLRKNWIYLDKYSDKKSHGTITLIQALIASCDTYFWEIGKVLNTVGNGDSLRIYANQMGLGVKTGIDDIPEEIGYIPDPQSKFQKTQVRWGLGDNLNTVIGQGDVQVTPLQVARMMMGIANGGTLYHPVLVKRVGIADQPPTYLPQPAAADSMGLSPQALAGIQEGLCGVTRDKTLGTAYFVFSDWNFNNISVCGKTGTAQTAYPQPNGWFSAYAGRTGQQPDIAVVVLVERSREGSETAGPIARRIIEAYYGLPYEPWPDYWQIPYETLPDPSVSDGIPPH